MDFKNVVLTLLALCSFAYGQTRALFVATNGTVQWGATLRFDGALDFTTNGFAATTRSNLSLGLPALTNTSNAGLLSAIGAMTTNGSAAGLTNFPVFLLTTNGSAEGLTNFPAELLRTNGNAAALTNFPVSLLRTNGDGSGLTNLPNANLTNATGVLPIANGGTGATNASNARTALQLGTAATNDATAFQPANTNLTALASGDGSSLTNVTITDASTLTNFPAELLRTNGSAASLTNFPADLLRTNGNGSGLTGVATYPAFSNNAGKVLAVATNEAGVEWLPVSNTVTDASLLTNFPASLLTTNGNAVALTNFPADLLRTNGNAAGLTNFPTLNQNTTGTANNVTGTVQIANGGTGAANTANARINLLPSYTGNASRVLALNSNATDIVWAVDGGGTPDVSTATGVLPVANGGTGATNGQTALTNLGVFVGAAVAITTATNNTTVQSIAIGAGARNVSGANTVVGTDATSDDGSGFGGVSIGRNAVSSNSAVAIGYSAYSAVFGAAIGYNAEATGQGGAIGYNTIANNGGAIGSSAEAIRGFAGGQDAHASATNSSQIGTGTNSTDNTIQFLSAGTIDTNEWSRLAALSTYPTTNISVVGTNNTNTLVFSNGILVEVQ